MNEADIRSITSHNVKGIRNRNRVGREICNYRTHRDHGHRREIIEYCADYVKDVKMGLGCVRWVYGENGSFITQRGLGEAQMNEIELWLAKGQPCRTGRYLWDKLRRNLWKYVEGKHWVVDALRNEMHVKDAIRAELQHQKK